MLQVLFLKFLIRSWLLWKINKYYLDYIRITPHGSPNLTLYTFKLTKILVLQFQNLKVKNLPVSKKLILLVEAWTNLVRCSQFLGLIILLAKHRRTKSKCVFDPETTGNKQNNQNMNVVWISKIRCLSKDQFHTWDTSS